MNDYYLPKMNQIISSRVNRLENTLVFGENLDRGSFISGLSKNLVAGQSRMVKNVGNCEYTHCGVGFGLMMSGFNAVLFVKQLDFMMLGIDHFVSTYGLIRAHEMGKSLGSFTIVTAIYDQGFQGPQSSFRGLAEICSMSGASAFLLQDACDAEKIADEELGKSGFRFLALSQGKASDECGKLEIVGSSSDNSAIQFETGSDVTIVCFGYTLSYGSALSSEMKVLGYSASLFTINYVCDADWGNAIAESSRNNKLVIIDDTRGTTSLAFRFLVEALKFDRNVNFNIVRTRESISTEVSDEKFQFNSKDVLNKVFG